MQTFPPNLLGPQGSTPQLWSWKACAFIVGIAVTIDLLSVMGSPFLWVGIAALLAIGFQFWGQMKSLAVVMFTCGLLSYSPYETGALSRLYPGDIAIALFLVMWLVKQRSWSIRSLFRPDLINGPLFAMAIVIPISMVWSRFFPDPSVVYSFPHSDVSLATTQISQLGLLAATICMPFAVAAAVQSWKHVEAVLITLGSVVALGTLVTGAALVFGFGGSFEILGATRGYWEQPWHSSMPLSALILPFLYSGVLFGRRSLSAYGLVCALFVLCLFGVVLTFSREIWLLALLGLLSVSAVQLRQRIVVPIVAITVGLLLLALCVPRAMSAVTSFYNPDEVYGLDRIYFYVTGLQLFVTHLFLGVGAGNYQFFDRVYAEVSAGGISHNQFITIAAETGLPGLVAFLWLIMRVFRIRRRFNPREGQLSDPHYWLKAAGSVFVLLWVAECFFKEAFFVSAAAGGGTKTITGGIFAWILLGVLFAAFNLRQTTTSANA